MADPTSIQLPSTATVEDVMAALAKESIFDLPSLTKEMVTVAQQNAGAEDSGASIFIHQGTYVLLHTE
jgi:hypothetical protein